MDALDVIAIICILGVIWSAFNMIPPKLENVQYDTSSSIIVPKLYSSLIVGIPSAVIFVIIILYKRR